MIRNKVSIDRQINERLYQFLVPFEAPLNEVLIILDDIIVYVVDRIKDAEEKAKQENEKKELDLDHP